MNDMIINYYCQNRRKKIESEKNAKYMASAVLYDHDLYEGLYRYEVEIAIHIQLYVTKKGPRQFSHPDFSIKT